MQKRFVLAVCTAAALCGCADPRAASPVGEQPENAPHVKATEGAGAGADEAALANPDEQAQTPPAAGGDPAAQQAAQQQAAQQQQQAAQQQAAQQQAAQQQQQAAQQQQQAAQQQAAQQQQQAAQQQAAQQQQQAAEQARQAQAQPAPDQNDIAAMAPSTKMAYADLVGDNGVYDESIGQPPAGTYAVEVDVTNNIVKVRDGSGNIVRMMLCTTGDSENPTPTGTFKMGKQRERFGYFEEFDCYAQYWSQIDGDIFFHSVLYEEKSADTLIKGSYKNLGRSTSHGCVRLTVPDARWIFEHVAPGTECKVVKGPKDDALKQSLALPKA